MVNQPLSGPAQDPVRHLFRAGNQDLAPILLLHGTGGDETELIGLAELVAPDHPVLAIRGRVNENGMNRYFNRFALGDFDLESLEEESTWLLAEIRRLAAHYQLDLTKMIVMGYSNGANIGLHIYMSRSTDFAGVVGLHAMQLTSVTDDLQNLTGQRVFLSFGEHDQIVSENNFNQLKENLERSGCQLTIFQNAGGHHLTQTEVNAVKEWFDTTTKDKD